MKRIRYTKFTGDLASSIGLEDLMQALADFLLDSGFQDPYAQFSELNNQTMENLREAIRQALESGELFDEESQQKFDELSADQPAHRRVGLHGLGIAVNKIEDAVLGGVQARNERRPGHRALGRRGGPEPPEAARVPKMSDVGQFLPMMLEEARIHPVYAKNDDPLAVCR